MLPIIWICVVLFINSGDTFPGSISQIPKDDAAVNFNAINNMFNKLLKLGFLQKPDEKLEQTEFANKKGSHTTTASKQIKSKNININQLPKSDKPKAINNHDGTNQKNFNSFQVELTNIIDNTNKITNNDNNHEDQLQSKTLNEHQYIIENEYETPVMESAGEKTMLILQNTKRRYPKYRFGVFTPKSSYLTSANLNLMDRYMFPTNSKLPQVDPDELLSNNSLNITNVEDFPKINNSFIHKDKLNMNEHNKSEVNEDTKNFEYFNKKFASFFRNNTKHEFGVKELNKNMMTIPATKNMIIDLMTESEKQYDDNEKNEDSVISKDSPDLFITPSVFQPSSSVMDMIKNDETVLSESQRYYIIQKLKEFFETENITINQKGKQIIKSILNNHPIDGKKTKSIPSRNENKQSLFEGNSEAQYGVIPIQHPAKPNSQENDSERFSNYRVVYKNPNAINPYKEQRMVDYEQLNHPIFPIMTLFRSREIEKRKKQRNKSNNEYSLTATERSRFNSKIFMPWNPSNIDPELTMNFNTASYPANMNKNPNYYEIKQKPSRKIPEKRFNSIRSFSIQFGHVCDAYTCAVDKNGSVKVTCDCVN